VKLSIGNTKTVYVVVNEEDDLIDIAKNFCNLHKLNSDQHKDIANKMREAIQMKAIGMAEIYEKVITENDVSPLLKSAEKLVKELAKKRKQGMKELNEKTQVPATKKPKAQPKVNSNLYEKGMKRKAIWEAKRQGLNEEARRKEMEGVTFAPKIDAVTKEITKHMPNLDIRMNEQVTKAKAKIEVLKKSTIEKQTYSFKPTINPSYRYLSQLRSIRNSYQSVFDDLYGDGKKRGSMRVARSASSLSPEYTFRPDINLSQKDIPGSNRLSLAKKNPLLDVEPLIDSKTKQPLFTPIINKRSVRRKRSVEKILGEREYSAKKIKAKAPKLASKEKTKELISTMRNTTFKVIFGLLDINNDGVIETADIDDTSNIFYIFYRIT